jgi:hypothetical protein
MAIASLWLPEPGERAPISIAIGQMAAHSGDSAMEQPAPRRLPHSLLVPDRGDEIKTRLAGSGAGKMSFHKQFRRGVAGLPQRALSWVTT